MSCFVNPAERSAAIASVTAPNVAGSPCTVTRSKRTAQRPVPAFTVANGSVWIWPLSAIEQTQRQAGGSRRSARNADGSALFCMCSPGSGAADGCDAGHAAPSSRHAIDHRRIVSGGRPVIAHEHAMQSHGDERTSAWS